MIKTTIKAAALFSVFVVAYLVGGTNGIGFVTAILALYKIHDLENQIKDLEER